MRRDPSLLAAQFCLTVVVAAVVSATFYHLTIDLEVCSVDEMGCDVAGVGLVLLSSLRLLMFVSLTETDGSANFCCLWLNGSVLDRDCTIAPASSSLL